MFGWIKRLFGGGYETHLPPFTAQEVDRKEVKEIIDWGLQAMGVPDIWKETQGEGVKVAVLDTGVATKHPDLQSAIIKTKDFTGEGVEDGNGHGTHCSGIVLGRQNNDGVVGVAPKAELMIGKVLSNAGSGRISWIVEGMEWALAEGADIISMSLGSRMPSAELEQAVKKVINNHCILICAAGNDGQGNDTIGYPGHYEGVITVGSIKRGNKRSDFSSTGPSIGIMAPGEGILSCYPPDKFARLSGTSMATPFIAGVAALILSKHRQRGGNTPCENQKEMFDHLTKVALDMEDPGWDTNTGWGIVNPRKSLDDQD